MSNFPNPPAAAFDSCAIAVEAVEARVEFFAKLTPDSQVVDAIERRQMEEIDRILGGGR